MPFKFPKSKTLGFILLSLTCSSFLFFNCAQPNQIEPDNSQNSVSGPGSLSISITQPPANVAANQANSASFTVTDSLGTNYSVSCSIDGGVAEPCASPVMVTTGTAGTHSLFVYGKDNADATATGAAQVSWTVAGLAQPAPTPSPPPAPAPPPAPPPTPPPPPPAVWVQSGFGTCSKTCGGGVQTQSVVCQQGGVTVANGNCAGAAPASSQSCNVQACPPVTINVYAPNGCGSGFCVCVTPLTNGIPDATYATQVCQSRGYATMVSFTTAEAVGVVQCFPGTSSCLYNPLPGNIVCATVTCQ